MLVRTENALLELVHFSSYEVYFIPAGMIAIFPPGAPSILLPSISHACAARLHLRLALGVVPRPLLPPLTPAIIGPVTPPLTGLPLSVLLMRIAVLVFGGIGA